jgi:xylulokinase
MVEAVRVAEERLPPIVPSGSAAGALTPAAARVLGLRSGIMVAAGAADRAAEALSSGVTGSEAMVSMGTATGIVMSIDANERVEDAAILTPAHAVAGRAMALLSVAPSGAVLDWLVRLLVGDPPSDDARSRLLAEAAEVPAGASGLTFLPFLHGAKSVRWDQAARGVLAGLDLSVGRGALVRAALEGITFEVDACLRRLALAREGIGRLVLVGGGHRDALAGRLLVDVTGLPALRLDEPDAGAAGAMLLAGQALGAWSDPTSMARARRRGETLEPDPGQHALYREIAPRYEALCEAMGLPALAR